MDGERGCWTEERHSLYLNWIEASFVSRMLGGGCGPGRRRVRLARHIPDSDTESTGESPRRSPAATDVVDSEIIVSREKSSFSRKRNPQRHDASLDQVVPVFESGEDDAGVSVKRKK